MLRLHVADVCIERLQPKSARRKHRRERQVYLAQRQVLPRTLTTSSAKRHEILAQRRLLQEALGPEGASIREECGIVVEENSGHADRRHRRDCVTVIFEHRVGEETLHMA